MAAGNSVDDDASVMGHQQAVAEKSVQVHAVDAHSSPSSLERDTHFCLRVCFLDTARDGFWVTLLIVHAKRNHTIFSRGVDQFNNSIGLDFGAKHTVNGDHMISNLNVGVLERAIISNLFDANTTSFSIAKDNPNLLPAIRDAGRREDVLGTRIAEERVHGRIGGVKELCTGSLRLRVINGDMGRIQKSCRDQRNSGKELLVLLIAWIGVIDRLVLAIVENSDRRVQFDGGWY